LQGEHLIPGNKTILAIFILALKPAKFQLGIKALEPELDEQYEGDQD